MRAKRRKEWWTELANCGIIIIASDSLRLGEPVFAVVPVQIRVLAMTVRCRNVSCGFFVCWHFNPRPPWEGDQRKIERTIRKQKNRILVDEATGDADKLQMDQIRLRRLNEEYKRFSKAADLPLQRERAQVAGFGVKQITVAYEQNDKFHNRLAKSYTNSDNKIKWPHKGKSITTEQYKDLRAYAESRGVFLQGFKNSDVDISLTKEAVDTATQLFEKYPELQGSARKPFTLHLDRYMQSVDFAEVKDGASHILHLNADAYRNKSALQAEYGKLAAEGWFVRGTSYKSVIYHEMGHMASEVYGIDGLAVMKEVLNTDSTAETLLWCKNNLSGYSFKSDGSEIISEMFSAFYGTDSPSKEIVDFMSRCDKIILDRRE